MSTKFLARFFDRGTEWPTWRKCVWLALLSATLAFICALAASEYDGQLLVIDLLAIPLFWGASAFYVLSSGAHFVKWQRRQREHGTKTDPVMNWTAAGFFATAVLVVVFLLGWGLDRQGVVNIPYFHQGSAVERLNPLICVNDTPSAGFAAPLTEKLAVTGEIRSIELCPHPFTYSLHVEGMRFRGETVASSTPRFDFDPPLRLKPGEEIEITVIGKELSVYKQTNSPTYVIYRQQPYSLDEIRGYLTEGDREPGYKSLDWERMEKEGLFYLDHSSDPNTRRVDAIYATYATDTELNAWSARFPRGYEIVKIQFSFCVKPESDFFLMGSMQNLPLWRRGILITIEQDGTVLVLNPEDRTILFVCGNYK